MPIQNPTAVETLTLTYPSELSPTLEALADFRGYSGTIPDPDNEGETLPNPQTKLEFIQERVVDFITNEIAAMDIQQSENTARAAAMARRDILKSDAKEHVKIRKVPGNGN